jgi:hypothetical protein
LRISKVGTEKNTFFQIDGKAIAARAEKMLQSE